MSVAVGAGDECAALEICRSALIGRAAASTFDVIEAAEHYPSFLPWCASAVILARDESLVVARIAVDYHGVRFEFTTRNPKDRPRWLAVRMEEGPFRHFEGEWRLTELAPDACKVQFTFRYAFASGLVSRFAGPVFNGITETLIDAFARRVEQAPALPKSPSASGPDSLSTQGPT